MNADRKQQLRELTDWATEQLREMGSYAQEIGLIPQDVTAKAFWVLPNKLCIGQVWPKHDPSQKFWVITGDVSTDHVDTHAAQNARDAARHFALRWQLHSAQLMQGLKDETESEIDWQKVGRELAAKAEYIYALVEDDEIWKHAVEPDKQGAEKEDLSGDSSEPA